MGWFRILIETWWWVLLGALVGLVVGYLLGRMFRSQKAAAHPDEKALRSEIETHRALVATRDDDLAALRREKDALAKQHDDVAARLVTADKDNGELDANLKRAKERGVILEKEVADRDKRIKELERDLNACRDAAAEAAAKPAVAAAAVASAEANEPAAPVARSLAGAMPAVPAPAFDAKAAAAAYGSAVKLDDLKIVEGIGPKIEELMHGGGIRTWRQLAEAPVERLQEILRGGGDRFRMHDPATWPEQSELAADFKFAELKALQDRLNAGRE